MLTVALHPHPTSPEPAVSRLELLIERTVNGLLQLEYRLAAELDALRTAAFAQPHRADRLWEHTCFELFVGLPQRPDYCELNFATSGAWAAYRFSDYREGMQPIEPLSPLLQLHCERTWFSLRVSLPLADLDPAYTRSVLRLAPSAVIEHRNGQRSYWAVRHAAAKPDFHHRDAFAITLAALEH